MEEAFLTSFGQRIKAMRLKNDLTQSELAEKMGYSEKSSIARIEHGKVDLPSSKVEEFSNVLHCSAAYLMGWEDPVEESPWVLSDIEKQIIVRYRSLPEGERNMILRSLGLEEELRGGCANQSTA